MPDANSKMNQRLAERKVDNALRQLRGPLGLIDFSSNDYLGFAQNGTIFRSALDSVAGHQNGSTGSRLITGNHSLYLLAETAIATFHQTQSALIFNSGYDANLGVFSSVPQRGDVVLFDEFCHASIRDGLRLSQARSFKFAHNDLDHLAQLLEANSGKTVFVATESVFSMDGDSPPIVRLVELCEQFGAHLIIDEAHSLGVFGNGAGLVQEFDLQDRVFARVVTFGKAMGCHGAAVLGSKILSDYLVNFARSFIYTTALPPHSVATIMAAYSELQSSVPAIEKLRDNIAHFSREKARLGLGQIFVGGKSAIASAIIPGNEKVREIAACFAREGFDVRAILSPTVPGGQERLRFCIHSFNTQEQITTAMEVLSKLIFN